MDLISRKEALSLGLPRYFTGKPCKNGHVDARSTAMESCMECIRERGRNRDKERAAESRRKSYIKDIEASRQRARDDYRKRLVQIKGYQKVYQKTESFLAACRRSSKKIRKAKPWIPAIRNLLNGSIARIGSVKTERTNQAIGYSPEKLKQRIEFNFKPGMSWENHGEWHIDHVKPVARFSEQGIKDPKLINCLSNLRPMWATENIKKGAKWQGMK
jgi:hypothetical protein